MKENLKQIWKDPVWSKIIAAVILTIFTFIYNYFQAKIKKESVYQTIADFWNKKFELWEISIFFFIIIILIYISFKRKRKKKNEEINSFDGVDLYNIDSAFNFEYDENSKILDIELFNKIKNELLVTEKEILWLREQGFSYGFQREKPYSFFNFEEIIAENPNYEFLDTNLELLKSQLVRTIQKFNKDLRSLTFPEYNKDFQSVPKEWRESYPEKYENAVQTLEDDKKEVLDTYDELIRKGRKILKV